MICVGMASVPTGFPEMNANSIVSPPRRRRRRKLILAAIGTGLLGFVAIYLADAVRQARNAADSASTT
jgi:hypothetical protein